MKAFGRIDVLHNNVGIIDPGGPEQLTEAQWDRLMAVNVKSIYLTCRNILPIMTKLGKGSIINVSSIASTHSLGYSCISYSASKGAVNAFTRDIALNYGPKGIRCNTILPGLMNTPLIHMGNVTAVYGNVMRSCPWATWVTRGMWLMRRCFSPRMKASSSRGLNL